MRVCNKQVGLVSEGVSVQVGRIRSKRMARSETGAKTNNQTFRGKEKQKYEEKLVFETRKYPMGFRLVIKLNRRESRGQLVGSLSYRHEIFFGQQQLNSRTSWTSRYSQVHALFRCTWPSTSAQTCSDWSGETPSPYPLPAQAGTYVLRYEQDLITFANQANYKAT